MKFKKRVDDNVFRLIVLLAAVLVLMGLTKGSQIMKVSIFQTIGRSMSEIGLMAVGCGICMIAGGIDLSCVYIANLVGITSGLMMQQKGAGIALAIIIGIIVGAACGAFNGLLVSYLRIPAMLATLGTYQVFQGISIVLSGGSTVSGIPEAFTDVGAATVGVIPVPFIIYLVIIVLMTFLMSKTSFGKRVFFVGTNERTSVFAGIKTKKVLILTYMISGILCGIAGLLELARINSAKADFGSSYTNQCILVSVMGGINPNGGFGTIPGVAIAVLILQLLSAYLNTFPNISNYYRDLIWGAALIGVLIANYYFDKRKLAKQAKN